MSKQMSFDKNRNQLGLNSPKTGYFMILKDNCHR